jgi:hypothetical protein
VLSRTTRIVPPSSKGATSANWAPFERTWAAESIEDKINVMRNAFGRRFGVIDKFVCPDVNGAEKANHGVDFISDREALNIISDDMSVPAQYSPMAPFESSQFDLPPWYIILR